MTEELNQYISRRYDSWLDYATYHCERSRLPLEPIEVLNDVLCSLMQGCPERIEKLYRERHKDLTSLDYFVLRVIRINIHSPRSRTRYRKGQYCTHSVDWAVVAPSEQPACEEQDHTEEVLPMIRQLLSAMDIPERDKRIFAWRFFDGRSFEAWPGPERPRALQRIFRRVSLKISSQIVSQIQR